MTQTHADEAQRWLDDARSALGREQSRVAEAVRDLSPDGWDAHLSSAAAAQLTSLGHFEDYGTELSWTPREVVGHLRDSARIFAGRIRLLQADRSPVLADFVTDDPARLLDYAAGTTEQIVTDLEVAQLELRLTLASVTIAQLPHRGRHEVDGELSLADVVAFLPGHQRDHAEQLLELVSPESSRPPASSDGRFVRTPSGVLVPAVIDPFHRALHHVAPAGLVGATAQTAGMRRLEAISGATVGARNLWMGQTHVPGATASADHHHGASETAIYVVSGHPVFVFLDVDGDEPVETRIDTGPGDYVFVPPFVPHREENPDPSEEAVVVIARTTQEAVVVNLDGLNWAQVDASEHGGT